MLKRGWKWIVALCTASAVLARMREVWKIVLHTDATMEAISQPPVADITEKELDNAAPAKAAAEQVPPTVSIPVGTSYQYTELQYASRFTPVDDWGLAPRPR
jgi:hypothetical protein